jgi:hypothetical protein
MAPPTSSHLWWKPLRVLGVVVLDLPALIIIIVAGRKTQETTFGLIGVGIEVTLYC